MKFLKGLLIAVIILIAIVSILGLVMPKEYSVERSMVIDACPGVVYKEFANFKNWEDWSPWAEKDQTIQSTYEGEDGQVGSIHRWTGNPDISGQGSMTMTEMTENEIKYDLQFIVPFESESKGYFKMEEVEGGVKVSWGDGGKIPFPMNVIAGLFMDFDKMIGADFEKGLQNMSEKLAGQKAYSPQFRESPEIHYVGVRMQKNAKDLNSELYDETIGNIIAAMMVSGTAMAGAPMTLMHTFDEETMDMDLEIAVPTISLSPAIDGFTVGTIPAGRDAFGIHLGAYEATGEMWNNMESYYICSREELRYMPYEQYVTDPGVQADTSLWETYIVYPLAAK